LTEAAKFVASAMGLKEIAKCVGSTVGSAPPAKLGPVHAKSSKPSESAMLFPASPGSVAKTVTVLPLAVERTPTAPPFRSMAAARFAAIVVVTRTVLPDQIWKFERVFEPSVPAVPGAAPRVVAAQEYPVSVLARAMALAVVPAVAAVTVAVGVPVVLAVTPAVAGVPQALIASPRLVARPDAVESSKKLAVAVVAHEVEVPVVP